MLVVIRELHLLQVTLLDWLIKLKRRTINVLLQILCFQEVLNVSVMEYFMYSSIFYQFNVCTVAEPGRMYLPGTLELPTFTCKLLIFMGYTLANKEPSRKY